MSQVSIYLNFSNQTEEAFNFYKAVFGTEFEGEGIMRYTDVPPSEDMPPMSKTDQQLVMHVTLPIMDGFQLMGSDIPEGMGLKLSSGNNININLMPETRAETEKLFNALSKEGTVIEELQDMFWGDYYGTCMDKFGIIWMFNCAEKQ